jgi:hypothetical protein
MLNFQFKRNADVMALKAKLEITNGEETRAEVEGKISEI